MEKLTQSHIKELINPRNPDTHKGNYGHALLLAGNQGRMGAVVIAVVACLRAGVGLVTANVPLEERVIVQAVIPEAMVVMREEAKQGFDAYSAAGIGPGLGTDAAAKKLLIHILSYFRKPLLVDADALTMIAADEHLFSKVPEGTIFTPHPKEFDRLFGDHANEKERISTAIKKAVEHQVVIVLKGHHTLVTYSGQSFVNTTGNAGLAKGGSGDALTGIITAFLAQGYEPFQAAKLGVFIHGLAADIALKKQSMESMLITDVIACLGKAWKQIRK